MAQAPELAHAKQARVLRVIATHGQRRPERVEANTALRQRLLNGEIDTILDDHVSNLLGLEAEAIAAAAVASGRKS